MNLKIENFACFDKAELLMTNGLTLIHGENDSGKTSLADSLSFLLYGYSRLDSKKGISNIIKKGKSFCKVELETDKGIFFREKTATSNKTNIEDISKLTPINYDIYKQIVHINFATSIMQMTSGKKNTLLSALSDSEVINNCSNNLKKDLEDLQKVFNNCLREMYGIQGVIKEFNGKPSDEFKAFSKTDMESKIQNVLKIINDCQNTKNDFIFKQNQSHHNINILKNNNVCPNCLQLIEEDYKNTQLESLNSSLEVIHKQIGELNGVIEANKKTLHELELNLDNYIKYNKVQEKINLLNIIEDKIKKLDKEIGIHKKWYDFFSSTGGKGAKAVLAITYTQYLEEYIKNLQKIFEFDMELNWEDNNLSIYINEIPYDWHGNGVKRRIDILLSLAMRQLVVYLKGDLGVCNYLIMDELFNNLDSKGITDTLELLKALDISYPTYVISPRYVDFEWDNVINIKSGTIAVNGMV